MPMTKRHRFFLNPYEEYAFTKCPKCDAKTRIRKFPLVIHIEPCQLFLLNKECKYCPECDLIIARQSEIESFMAATMEVRNPEIIGNDYLMLGTMDRRDWRLSHTGKINQSETLDRVLLFEEAWNFEIIPGGWYRNGERPSQQANILDKDRG